LDALGSARMRRERYVGSWLPDPLVDMSGGDVDPADRVTLDDTVGHALLFVLERLSPAERTAFILHDVFGYSLRGRRRRRALARRRAAARLARAAPRRGAAARGRVRRRLQARRHRSAAGGARS